MHLADPVTPGEKEEAGGEEGGAGAGCVWWEAEGVT